MNPIINPVSGAGPFVVEIKQPNVVAPESEFRVSVERIGSATGTVTVLVRYFGCIEYNKIGDVNLADSALTATAGSGPVHFNFAGDIDSVKFSHVSLVGSYNTVVGGR